MMRTVLTAVRKALVGVLVAMLEANGIGSGLFDDLDFTSRSRGEGGLFVVSVMLGALLAGAVWFLT